MEQKLRLSSEAAIRGHKKRLAQAEKRLGELDRLFIRIYEDNVAERITDERFSMMSKTYEDEQAQLKEEIQTLRQEIEVQERQYTLQRGLPSPRGGFTAPSPRRPMRQ